MWYRLAADFVLAIHFAFIGFVVLGGLLALAYPRAAYLHVPAACWGAIVELTGRLCPLTGWENALRAKAGQSGYAESFIEHYLLPLVYPAGLTRETQLWLGGIVIVINLCVYGWVVHHTRRRRTRRSQ